MGSSFEDESVFGLRFWQVQKVVCSSLCLHIPKPKKSSPDWVRVLQKKQPSCQTHCDETCMPPFPQFNVVTSLCFERPSKKTAISVRMPACIGQQHWSRGRGGIRCDVTTCRRMAVFFEEPGIIYTLYISIWTLLNTTMYDITYSLFPWCLENRWFLVTCSWILTNAEILHVLCWPTPDSSKTVTL